MNPEDFGNHISSSTKEKIQKIPPNLLDGVAHLIKDIQGPQRMNPGDFGDPLSPKG